MSSATIVVPSSRQSKRPLARASSSRRPAGRSGPRSAARIDARGGQQLLPGLKVARLEDARPPRARATSAAPAIAAPAAPAVAVRAIAAPAVAVPAAVAERSASAAAFARKRAGYAFELVGSCIMLLGFLVLALFA